MDEGHSVHACFLDVAKAFDRVDHDLLLHKLEKIVISGVPLRWFWSYLYGRFICTVVDGTSLLHCLSRPGCRQALCWGPYCLYFTLGTFLPVCPPRQPCMLIIH